MSSPLPILKLPRSPRSAVISSSNFFERDSRQGGLFERASHDSKEFGALSFVFSYLFNPLQPRPSHDQRHHGNRQPNAEIFPEPDLRLRLGTLDHDNVR